LVRKSFLPPCNSVYFVVISYFLDSPIEIGNRFPSLELIEKIAKVLKIRPHLLFYTESDNDSDEQVLKKKKGTISEIKKEELTNRLTDAIRKIIKNID